MDIMHIIAIILVIDSLGALWVAWFGQRWYLHHVGMLSMYLPPAKGWALWYFVLTLLILALEWGWL